MKNFKAFPFSETLQRNIDGLGFKTPTAIQMKAIPFILQGRDILGIAQTGTGKTAAFGLPILQQARKALILVPTRELAIQIQKSFESYGQGTDIKTVALFGGVDQDPQIRSLRAGVDVIIATPGRLLDLIEQKQVPLKDIKTLVLDEADQMLDMGFIEDIELIISKLPIERQTLFFSATMPPEVIKLSGKILKNPELIEASANSSTVKKIVQKVIFCKRDDKFQLLRKKLKEEERELVIVFTKTRNSADKVREYLRAHRLAATVIHGDKSQDDRGMAIENFKNGSVKILIATDIAARGIDIQGISHVINFELPLDPENYVHRIGRTARAGKTGMAISFCDDSEREMLKKIQDLINLKLPTESFKGSPEAPGIWSRDGAITSVKAPTPGLSQEKRAHIDHSKRQKVAPGEPSKAKSHPGFRNKKKKR